MITRRAALGALAALAAWPARAGEADVIGVDVRRRADGTYDFDVTIRSNDRDGTYFADQFEVLAPDGRVLGVRELFHDHADEQPFTRELHGLRVPNGVSRVTVRARHRPRGYDGATMTIDLPRGAN